MPGVTPKVFSGGTSGTPILIAATTTAGTLIHTAAAGADDYDEVWLWAFNDHTADLLLSIEFGGVTDPKDVVRYTVPFRDGPHLVIPGWRLNGGLIVRAFAATTNLISVNGNINRITSIETV